MMNHSCEYGIADALLTIATPLEVKYPSMFSPPAGTRPTV